MNARKLFLLSLLACLPLASCRIVGNKADFSGVADVFTPPADDNVVVEGRTPVSTTIAAAPAPSVAPATTTTAAPGSYVVRPGDTLSAIARRNGVSLAALLAANGMGSAAPVIRPGQALRLPAAKPASTPRPSTAARPAASTKPSTAARSYTMRAGDTLSAVARKHGVSLQALLKANELTEGSARFVQPGATLTIPSQH